jgi:hypothetical protein
MEIPIYFNIALLIIWNNRVKGMKKRDKHVRRIGVFENKNLLAANSRILAVLMQ